MLDVILNIWAVICVLGLVWAGVQVDRYGKHHTAQTDAFKRKLDEERIRKKDKTKGYKNR